jgi:gamma-D-glutamyl-L-lysine dipeptidyl-peptidase
MFGVCNLSVIPLRAEPSEKAEMTSQLLFGDAYSIVEKQEKWIRIKMSDCGFEAWMDAKLYNPLHEKDIDAYLEAHKYMVRDLLLFITDFETNISFPVFIGSSFPYPQNDLLILGSSIFIVKLPDEPQLENHPDLSEKQMAMIRFASTYLEAPYLWGGRTPAGIDCSGFVQMVFKSIGVQLPRNASQQALEGDNVDFVEETRIGDVAFFHNEEGAIIHTGIVCGMNKIIHASGKVRIDSLDSNGIYNKNIEKYSHNLRVIKRL